MKRYVLKQYFTRIRQYSWVLLVCALLATLSGIVLSKVLPQSYQASAKMYLNITWTRNTFTPRISPAQTYTTAVDQTSQIVSRSVMEYVFHSDPLLKKHGYTADTLMPMISTTPSALVNPTSAITDLTTITITATAPNPDDAVLIANDVATGFQNYKQAQLLQELNQQRKALQDQYNTYQNQSRALENQILNITNPTDPHIALLTADRADIINNMENVQAQLVQLPVTVSSNVVVTQLAKVSDETTALTRLLILASTVGLGLLIGIVVLLFFVFLENRLRGEEEANDTLELAYLGGLFQHKQLKTSAIGAVGPAMQQLSDISANLRLTGILPGEWRVPQGAVLLITSPQAVEGRTTIATALAASVARAGRNVVVVDGNLRNPTTHLAFGMSPAGPGLSGLLKSDTGPSVDQAVLRTSVPNVWLLAGSAPLDDAGLLLQEKLPAILAELRKKADLIIIDGPPLFSGAEASLLANMADGVALIVDASYDKVPQLLQAKELLDALAHIPVGVILNRLPRRQRNPYFAAASRNAYSEMRKSVPVYAN